MSETSYRLLVIGNKDNLNLNIHLEGSIQTDEYAKLQSKLHAETLFKAGYNRFWLFKNSDLLQKFELVESRPVMYVQ